MRILLAPMQGVVDHHLRHLLTELGGFDGAATEFIRVTQQRLPKRVFLRYCPELNSAALTPSGVPVKVQLLGNHPRAMAYNAAKAAEFGASAIDINFGCPAKTVNNSFGGARLLEQPALMEKIVAEVRNLLPEGVSLSAKIRLGFNSRDSYLDAAKAIAAGGANELVVHARSKQDGYRPPAYWHTIAEIKQHVSIPLVANGEIWSIDDWQRCRAQAQVNDVMIGRGALARPDLALAIKHHHAELPFTPMGWTGACALLHRYHQQTKHEFPAKYLGNRVKQWLAYLQLHYPEAEHFLQKIKRSRDDAFLEDAFAQAMSAPEPSRCA